MITTNDLATWLAEQTWSDFATSLAAYHAKHGYLTEKQEAAARKMHAKMMAKGPVATKGPALEVDGIFAKGDDVYKVQWNKDHTNLYAKRLVEDVATAKGFTWEYVGKGPLYTLTEDDRLTAEKAKALGALYGVCVFCSATLTDEPSIAAGYGPICASNNGLPWGHVDHIAEHPATGPITAEPEGQLLLAEI